MKSTAKPDLGDYVIATKWRDGDPHDQFAIGFYAGSFDHFGTERHLVNDDSGQPFRANGFRRVARISPRRGAWLVARLEEIQRGDRSIWWWYRQTMRTAKKGGRG